MRLLLLSCLLCAGVMLSAMPVMAAAEGPRVLALVDMGALGLRGDPGWADLLTETRPDCRFTVIGRWRAVPWAEVRVTRANGDQLVYSGMHSELEQRLSGRFDQVLIALNTAVLDSGLVNHQAVSVSAYSKLVAYLQQHSATKDARIALVSPFVVEEKGISRWHKDAFTGSRTRARQLSDQLSAWADQQGLAWLDGLAFAQQTTKQVKEMQSLASQETKNPQTKSQIKQINWVLPSPATAARIADWLALQLSIPGAVEMTAIHHSWQERSQLLAELNVQGDQQDPGTSPSDLAIKASAGPGPQAHLQLQPAGDGQWLVPAGMLTPGRAPEFLITAVPGTMSLLGRKHKMSSIRLVLAPSQQQADDDAAALDDALAPDSATQDAQPKEVTPLASLGRQWQILDQQQPNQAQPTQRFGLSIGQWSPMILVRNDEAGHELRAVMRLNHGSLDWSQDQDLLLQVPHALMQNLVREVVNNRAESIHGPVLPPGPIKVYVLNPWQQQWHSTQATWNDSRAGLPWINAISSSRYERLMSLAEQHQVGELTRQWIADLAAAIAPDVAPQQADGQPSP